MSEGTFTRVAAHQTNCTNKTIIYFRSLCISNIGSVPFSIDFLDGPDNLCDKYIHYTSILCCDVVVVFFFFFFFFFCLLLLLLLLLFF